MNKPLISVVTPSYNQSNHLPQLLDCVGKAGDFVEHIVVDGGSTDETVPILKEKESEYRLRWISEPDEGIADAVNKGIGMAEGRWVGFQNADDYYLPGAFRIYKRHINSNRADVIYGDQLFVDTNNQVKGVRVHTYPSKFIQKHWQHFASYHTMLINRELLLELDGFNEDYKYMPDAELLWRLLSTDTEITFKHIPQFVAARKKHSESISATESNSKEYQIERESLYEYSKLEQRMPESVLIFTSVVIKLLYLIQEKHFNGFYNTLIDFFGKTFTQIDSKEHLWLPKENKME